LVLLFDTNSYTPPDLDRAIATAKKFIQTRTKSADKVAVMVSSEGIRVMQDFTVDRDLLIKAIEQVGALSISDTPTATGPTQLAALETAIRMLGALPEKKALIYLSNGLARTGDNQVQLQSTINTAIRANVAIFPIDTRGLVEK
jgi:VWFA-related protein